MRRQRFAITLPTTSETELPNEPGETSSAIFSSHYSLHEPMWTPIYPSEQEPIMPCYLYQYPVIQVPTEQYQSVSSIFNSANFAFNPCESFSYFGDGPPIESGEFANSSPISDSGYGDCIVPEMYPFQEFPYEGLQALAQDIPDSYPMVTSYGAVTILLRHLIRVDISPEKAVYVTNSPSECVAVACGTGDRSGVMHPNGRVLHEREDIHMSTLNRKAKISKRGIVFTSADHCLSYLVDASGTKTTAEKFRDLSQDFTHQVFFCDSMSSHSMDLCYKMVEDAVHKHYKNGDEVWIVGGYRIKQDQWGDVKVSRNYGRRVIKVSPTNGQVNIKTDSVEITVGRYPNNYFVVRRGDQMVTASLRSFTVQSGTQRAGFNSTGRLVLK
ncbi:uncharacterized protein TNCV_760121 [Trichonephila clavipes]|nr:uncharacterized protein TNCV_760121 [Trichonephila clavipes]